MLARTTLQEGDLIQEIDPGQRLLQIYEGLAARGAHLFDAVIGEDVPEQWRHYPENDAIDAEKGYLWFYHTHSPQDRPGDRDHGHIHLFARRKAFGPLLKLERERAFAERFQARGLSHKTRHLLTIGFEGKGLPTNLFTVNSWVTGDRMLSAEGTASLLEDLQLETGHPDMDGVIGAICQLCRTQIARLLASRNAVLLASTAGSILNDESVEVLSSWDIEFD